MKVYRTGTFSYGIQMESAFEGRWCIEGVNSDGSIVSIGPERCSLTNLDSETDIVMTNHKWE